MSRPDSFTLPPQLEHYREDITEAHAQLRGQDVAAVCAALPPTEWVDKTAYVRYTPEHKPEKVDPEHAIVVPFTFGNGNGTNQFYRMRLLQNVVQGIDEQPRQIIGFPMPSSRVPKRVPKKLPSGHEHVERPFKLDEDELEAVADGDFTPITDQHHMVLCELGIKHVDVIGYSCGAAIAASLAASAEEAGLTVGAVGLFEPPNLRAEKTRTPLKLKVAHALAGLDFIRCVQESNLPGFTQLQQARWRDVPGQLRDSMKSRVGDRNIPEQAALETGLAEPTFDHYLKAFFDSRSEKGLLVARGGYSGVTSRSGFDLLRRFPQYEATDGTFRLAEIAGYGHGMGNNLPLFTALSLAALRGEDIPPATA